MELLIHDINHQLNDSNPLISFKYSKKMNFYLIHDSYSYRHYSQLMNKIDFPLLSLSRSLGSLASLPCTVIMSGQSNCNFVRKRVLMLRLERRLAHNGSSDEEYNLSYPSSLVKLMSAPYIVYPYISQLQFDHMTLRQSPKQGHLPNFG